MALRGRPRLELDTKQIELLAGCFCTNEEIAGKLGCSADTLVNNYSESLKKGRDNAKASLRVMQFQLAKKNAAMAIFLGKNYLGQRDKHELDLNTLTPEQALAILAAEGATGEDSGSGTGEVEQ